MKNNLSKVLMLGWEFPPVINGGLGVACHDLSSAMSKGAHVTMVVPKTSPDFKMKNVNLVGVNNVDLSQYKNQFKSVPHQLPFDLHGVPIDLDPYYTDTSMGFLNTHFSGFLYGNKGPGSFDIENLYGGDVIKKVFQFADIATAMAANMDFDIIHAHDWMTMVAGIKIKQATGKPLVVHIHSLEVDRSGEESRGWVYELEKKGMEYADLLLPVSHFTANNIHTHYGIGRDKMRVIHNGSTAMEPYKSPKPYKEKTVLFVGRLTRQKGPEKFLDIASKVLESDSKVRFVMAGTGDYFKQLLDQSSYQHIGNRFHLTGFLNMAELRYLFSVSDIYCMPSVSEPFGLSAVEAAQFGIPCVISRQSGVSEVLNGALKFDFWDTNKAADCILSLLNNPVLREKIVEDASSNLNNITWDISARKVMNAYAAINY